MSHHHAFRSFLDFRESIVVQFTPALHPRINMVPSMASLHNDSLRERTSDHVASQTSGDIRNADSLTFIAADREESRGSSPPKNVENATFGASNSSFAKALPIVTSENLARDVNPNAAEKEVASVDVLPLLPKMKEARPG